MRKRGKGERGEKGKKEWPQIPGGKERGSGGRRGRNRRRQNNSKNILGRERKSIITMRILYPISDKEKSGVEKGKERKCK